MNKKLIFFGSLTAVLLAYGFYQAMWAAPTEVTMGDVQRIFYYHVPSAAAAFLLFAVNFVASISYLARRGRRADALAVSAAEVGVVFTTAVLVQGTLWAKPVWGIWWTWDPRLTTTLVLWLIYVSYLVLRRFSSGEQTPVLAAALGVFAFLDVPIVYMANRWWRTQHPQPVFFGGPNSGLDPRMQYAFLANLIAFFCFGAMILWLRYRLERSQQELQERQAMQALAEPPVPRAAASKGGPQ